MEIIIVVMNAKGRTKVEGN